MSNVILIVKASNNSREAVTLAHMQFQTIYPGYEPKMAYSQKEKIPYFYAVKKVM